MPLPTDLFQSQPARAFDTLYEPLDDKKTADKILKLLETRFHQAAGSIHSLRILSRRNTGANLVRVDAENGAFVLKGIPADALAMSFRDACVFYDWTQKLRKFKLRLPQILPASDGNPCLQAAGQIWYLMRNEDPSAGSLDADGTLLIFAAREIGKLAFALKQIKDPVKTPPGQRYFSPENFKILKHLEKSAGESALRDLIISEFETGHAAYVGLRWEDQSRQLCHTGINPENILVRGRQIVTLLSLESIRAEHPVISLGWSAYLLLANYAAAEREKLSPEEFRSIVDAFLSEIVINRGLQRDEIPYMRLGARIECVLRLAHLAQNKKPGGREENQIEALRRALTGEINYVFGH